MRKPLVTLALALALSCGGALPYIVTGITTAAQLIDVFDNMISPQQQEASDNCAEQITSAASGDLNLTAMSAACAELTDAFLALQAAVDRLKANEKDPAAFDRAKLRLEQYDASFKRYETRVP